MSSKPLDEICFLCDNTLAPTRNLLANKALLPFEKLPILNRGNESENKDIFSPRLALKKSPSDTKQASASMSAE
jgi:hypothetical protein